MAVVEGLWADAVIYNGTTEHRMSDNLYQYLEGLKKYNGDKKKAAMQTWTYKRAEEQGYTVVERVIDETGVNNELKFVRATFIKP